MERTKLGKTDSSSCAMKPNFKYLMRAATSRLERNAKGTWLQHPVSSGRKQVEVHLCYQIPQKPGLRTQEPLHLLPFARPQNIHT